METLSAFFQTILNYIGSALLTIIGQGLLFAVVGLCLAILFISLGRKYNWFQRSFGLWTFVAKLNYLYLPVLFLVFGLSAGVLKGIHSSAGNIIDAASDEFIDYAQAYVTDLQEYIAKTPIKVGGVTVEDVIDAHLKANAELGWFSGIVAKAFNMIIVGHCMDKMGIKGASTDPMIWWETFSKEDFSKALLSIPSLALHTHCDLVFWGFFVTLFTVFTPFFMFPVYEFLLHIVVKLISGSGASHSQAEYSY